MLKSVKLLNINIMQRKILFKHLETVTYLKNHKGIYMLRNLVTKDFYIGSTDRNFKERFLEHYSTYNRYMQNGGILTHPKLGKAFTNYGMDQFEAIVFEVMDNSTQAEILAREGYYIRTLKPKYNVAQEPEVGGSPNKGKKLTEEGKQHIAEKSAQYKHSVETLALVTKNNKKNACKIIIKKENEILSFNSVLELTKFFNLCHTGGTLFQKALKGECDYKGGEIIKLSSQKKGIKVYFEDFEKTFESFNACDRFLGMGRGYTSTMYTRGIKLLKDQYKYEIL